MAESQSAPYIFISYASADRERVLPLVDALTRAGVGVWIDQGDIHGGANYGREIAEAIKGAAGFVLMASAASLTSRNVTQEIALAWRFERHYLPLLLEAVKIPDELAYWLEAAQWIEILDKPEAVWLPHVLAALAPLGIVPTTKRQEQIGLAGRERELALLRNKLAGAREGKGGLVLIGGEAGIGKTALAEAVLRDAERQGFALLEGHCFDAAEVPAYGPWLYLFERYRPGNGPRRPPAFGEPGRIGRITSQSALQRQVLDFLKALSSRQPIALMFDDAHWSDRESLDLLRFLAQSVESLPLLMLVTYRSDELSRRHPLYHVLPLLVREAHAERLDLHPLDDDSVRALVAGRYQLSAADTDRLVAYLQARAEGNALFVGELLRMVEGTDALRCSGEQWSLGPLERTAVPPLLRQVIDARLERLDEESQRLLAVAAVIGHEVPLDVWTTVGGVDADALLETVEKAMEARLLASLPGGERVRSAHALMREAIYEGVSAARRRRMHQAVADALLLRPHPDCDAIAHHLRQAGDDRAPHWLVRAGDRAQQAYAYLTAADRLEGALTLIPPTGATAKERGWLLVRLGWLRRWGNPQGGIVSLEEAGRIATEAGDPVIAGCALLLRGNLRCLAKDYRRGLADLEAGGAALDALDGDERARLAEFDTDSEYFEEDNRSGIIAVWLSFVGRYGEARAIAERVVRRIAASGGRALPNSSSSKDSFRTLGIAFGSLGLPDQAAVMFGYARAAYRRSSEFYLLAATASDELERLTLPYRSDHLAERRDLTAEAEDALTRGSGALQAEDTPRIASLMLLLIEGGWREARRIAERAFMAGVMGTSHRYVRIGLGPLAHRQGDVALAWTLVRETLPDGHRTTPGAASFPVAQLMQRTAVTLSLDAGDLAVAREWLEAHDRWLEWSGAVLGLSDGQTLWAQYHRQIGETDKASEHAERALAHATEPRQPLALLAAYRLLGELEADAGHYEDAAQHLDASLALAEACQAPYERALTLLPMAELRVATGDNDSARALIDEVRAICEPLGAKPTLVRATALAARLGSG